MSWAIAICRWSSNILSSFFYILLFISCISWMTCEERDMRFFEGTKKFQLGWVWEWSTPKWNGEREFQGCFYWRLKDLSNRKCMEKTIEKMNFWTSKRVQNIQAKSSKWVTLENCHSMNFFEKTKKKIIFVQKNKPQYSCCYNGTWTNPM